MSDWCILFFLLLLLILIGDKGSTNAIKVINTIANLRLKNQLREDHLEHYGNFLLELGKNQDTDNDDPASDVGRAYFTFYKAVSDMSN